MVLTRQCIRCSEDLLKLEDGEANPTGVFRDTYSFITGRVKGYF